MKVFVAIERCYFSKGPFRMSNYFTRFCHLLLFAGTVCLLVSFSTKALAQSKCERLFILEKIEGAHLLTLKGPTPEATISSFWTEVDGIRVSGDSFNEIRANLSLDTIFLNRVKNDNLSVLSIGEGISDLVPTLIENNINATGLDTWYHTSNLKGDVNPGALRMEKYQTLYARHLLRGSALSIPLKDESVDIVLAHKVVNYYHFAEQLEIVSQSIRVLTVSGEARLMLAEDRTTHREQDYYHAKLLEFILENYGYAVQASIDRNLLIITKLISTKNSQPVKINFDPSLKYDFLPTGHRFSRMAQRQNLISSYEKTLLAISHRPDDMNLKWDLNQITARIKNDRQVELTQRSPWQQWLTELKSRLSIKPERPKIED